MRRPAKAVLLALLVLCVPALAQGGDAREVQVLAEHKGWIDVPVDGPPRFGVNGTRVRWHDLTTYTSGRLRTLDVRASASSATGRWPAGLTFAGQRLAERIVSGGHNRSNAILVTDQSGRRRSVLEDFQTPDVGPGGYLTAPYAVGSTIAYGWYETEVVRGSCDNADFDCEYTIKRGGLRLIEGLNRGRIVTRAPVAALTLGSSGTAAYVRATPRWHDDWGPSVIEVITLESPRIRQRLRAPGRVTELAISDRVLALHTYLGSWNRRAIVLFDLGTGRRLRTVRQRGVEFVEGLALKGSRAVMFQGRALVALEAYTGSRRVLARTRGIGGGVAFAGDKLVWYETLGSNQKARYRVLSMSLT